MAARPSTPNRISFPAAMVRVEPISLEAPDRLVRGMDVMAFMVRRVGCLGRVSNKRSVKLDFCRTGVRFVFVCSAVQEVDGWPPAVGACVFVARIF